MDSTSFFNDLTTGGADVAHRPFPIVQIPSQLIFIAAALSQIDVIVIIDKPVRIYWLLYKEETEQEQLTGKVTRLL